MVIRTRTSAASSAVNVAPTGNPKGPTTFREGSIFSRSPTGKVAACRMVKLIGQILGSNRREPQPKRTAQRGLTKAAATIRELKERIQHGFDLGNPKVPIDCALSSGCSKNVPAPPVASGLETEPPGNSCHSACCRRFQHQCTCLSAMISKTTTKRDAQNS